MAKQHAQPQHKTLPNLPAPLLPLGELAYNLWWSWDLQATALFQSVDATLWDACEHNPVQMLRRVGKRRLQTLATDKTFIAAMKRAAKQMRDYLKTKAWFDKQHAKQTKGLVAYFSMEFGLHESLSIYAGGLGILAGDHFKSVSDLGLPLVGVGIFWRQGYSRQKVSKEGKQADKYDSLKPENLPLAEAKTPSGRPLRIRVSIGKDKVVARAWRLEVGRTPIFLLDTNLPENAPRDRKLTDRLYSGDRDMRIRQEVLLGIGGWKLLRALGLPIRVCHLNEGHAAFCSLERVAEIIKDKKCDFAQAGKIVAASTVFTTHTPIPEGNEIFAPKLVERYLAGECKRLGLDFAELLSLGRVDPTDAGEDFGMTPLALRLSNFNNGVSQLHGEVSRGMWKALWPKRSIAKVPIGAITNGVHLRTWLHPTMARLLDMYLPANWDDRQDSAAVWKAAKKIPDAELWATHVTLKRSLLAFVRQQLQDQLRRHGAGERQIAAAGAGLDPNALTIGFARRFATYKRATLVFSDLKRIERLIANTKRPVQIIFAGKAHPADEKGKRLVAEVVKYAKSRRFKGRVIFLEDYNMIVARHMVAGVDVWLNTPERPREASGTSGMKPPLHGGLNLSILDGWWPEICENGRNGWAIGKGEDHQNTADNKRDAKSLYQCLEREVVPLYYTTDRSGKPARWIKLMKHAIATIPGQFNSHRMVKEYTKRYYLPALRSAK